MLEQLTRVPVSPVSTPATSICWRCASTAALRPSTRYQPLDRRWKAEKIQWRGQAGAAAAMLEEAQAPEGLAQETIIQNLSSEEAGRLSRVRNIGIAV